MGTTRKTVKKRSESAAQSRSKSKPKPSLPKRKSGPHKGPTITWSKVKCFALGLAVAHQWKWRKNGTSVTDWHAVLEVINDIYLQEFEDFRKIYPNGLPNAGKLRSEYSDRDRGRHEKWQLRGDQCTPQEIQAMTRMAHLVVSTEHRLSSVPGSIVRNPAPNDPMWVWYPVNPLKATKTRKSNAKGASKKGKSKVDDDSEPESESGESDEDDHDGEDDDEEEQEHSEEGSDDNDEENQEDSEEQAGGDHNDDEESSNNENPGGHESFSRSDDPTAEDDTIAGDSQSIPIDVDADDDVIVVAIRPPTIVVDEDEDAERASDEEEIMNAADAIFAFRQKSRRTGKEKSRRAGHNARQTQPQRKKARFSEVHNGHEGYEERASSTHFQDALDPNNQSVKLQSNTIDFLKTFENGDRPVFKPKADLDLLPPSKRNKPGALDNAIIQAKAAEAVGNQGGLYMAPFNRKEFLRRHNQSDANAVRHDGEMSFKGLAAPQYPAIPEIQQPTLDPLLTYFDDEHTGNSYSECRRYLITAFQACHGFSVWDMLNRKRGFSFWDWEIFADLINPIVNTTGMSRDHVTRVVFHAKTGQPYSSLKFGKLLAMPAKIDGSKGEPNGTLDKIVQQIKQEPNLEMIHTSDVDFTTESPTYIIRKRMHGFGNGFRSIHSSESLYAQTGEVRRVLFKDETTGQGKEVDLMLCDKPVCQICQPSEPTDEGLTTSFEHAEQRKQLPLVHHKDIVMFEDEALHFVPMEQVPALEGAIIEKQDIHDVFFNGGKAFKVIFCDKNLCGACKRKKLVADLIYRGSR